jgi:hypothetical protein
LEILVCGSFSFFAPGVQRKIGLKGNMEIVST